MQINSKLKNVLEWVACIATAIILALLVKYFIATPTIVKSVSMYPTLIENQRLLLNRVARTFHSDLKRGEIVTFEEPSNLQPSSSKVNNQNPIAEYNYKPSSLIDSFFYYVIENTKTSFIKRVIALPGEHVEIKYGKVYVNGKMLDEPYLQDNIETEGNLNDFIVPDGTVFLMGDNRENSLDCRTFGCIPFEKIESKVWIRIWPLNLFGKVE